MKISIVTPTFNSEKTIEETIKSIIKNKETCPCDVEYIIIDGKSTDKTFSIIEKYRDQIDIYVSEKDNGISDAFNKGILRATGDVIGIINSDDMLTEGALKKLYDSIDGENEVYYGNGFYLEKDGTRKDFKAGKPSDLIWKMSLLHPSVFIKKSTYDKYGLFDTELKCVMDRDLLLRIYKGGARFKYISEPLSIYRGGGESYKNYFKYVVPESEQITIKYGGSIFRAKLGTLRRNIVMRIVFFKKKIFHH